MRQSIIAIGTLLILAGCEERGSGKKALLATVMTNKDTYHLENVGYMISNLSPDSLYVNFYTAVFRDRMVNGQWQFWTNAVYSDPTLVTVVIPPGANFRDSVYTAKPGTYRMGFPYRWSRSEMTPDTLYSNIFTIY